MRRSPGRNELTVYPLVLAGFGDCSASLRIPALVSLSPRQLGMRAVLPLARSTSICDSFTEGFYTEDLKDAKALLEVLAN